MNKPIYKLRRKSDGKYWGPAGYQWQEDRWGPVGRIIKSLDWANLYKQQLIDKGFEVELVCFELKEVFAE